MCFFFQVLKILVQTNEDRLFVVFNNGLSLLYEAFNMLQMMFHEATACHVTAEVRFLFTTFRSILQQNFEMNCLQFGLSLDKGPNQICPISRNKYFIPRILNDVEILGDQLLQNYDQRFIREGQTETAIILCKLNKSL